MDNILLISLGGMVLAVAVVAIFMRRKPEEAAEGAELAKVETVFADKQAKLLRYRCPHCAEVLRQEAILAARNPRAALSRAESGYPSGATVCPACGQSAEIISEDIQID
ncbi:hypothetical protein KQH50_02175 [bacterium]|nr:hypothetical protein [bacterium]